ncbi:unnamed protein product, partial [Arabidopsis halleri]
DSKNTKTLAFFLSRRRISFSRLPDACQNLGSPSSLRLSLILLFE